MAEEIDLASWEPEFTDLASAAVRAVPWVGAITSGGLARHLLRTDPPDHTRLRRSGHPGRRRGNGFICRG
jgi:hypothetical protein